MAFNNALARMDRGVEYAGYATSDATDAIGGDADATGTNPTHDADATLRNKLVRETFTAELSWTRT